MIQFLSRIPFPVNLSHLSVFYNIEKIKDNEKPDKSMEDIKIIFSIYLKIAGERNQSIKISGEHIAIPFCIYYNADRQKTKQVLP